MAERHRLLSGTWSALREHSRRSGRRRRARRGRLIDGVLFWLLLGGGALVLGGYAALCVNAGAKVPGGARVDGVSIGGLQPAAARARLREVLPERMAEPVRVAGGGLTQSVDPTAAGLRLDAAASVRAAGGEHSYWPGRIWRYYRGGEDRPAKVSVDDKALQGTVRRLGLAVDKPLTEGDVVLTRGVPRAVQPADGRRLRQDDTARALVSRVASAGQVSPQVALPVTTLRPQVSSAQVSRALTQVARPVTSAPVRLVVGGQQVTAPPRLYGQAIDLVPSTKGGLRPRLDVDRLFEALEPVINSVPGAPRPARIVVAKGRPRVVPSRRGVTFDRADLAKKFLAAAAAPAGERRAVVRGVSAEPSFTTAEAKKLQVRRRVGTFTSSFGYAGIVGGGNQNLTRGAALLDGTLLRPRQSFSFNRVLGRPTTRRGFVPGRSLQGATFVADAGAGLSQLASTLFNALLPTGLTPTQRSIASIPSDRLPVGREASVRYGSRDLTFTNSTPYGLLVTASATGGAPGRAGSVTVSLWSTKSYDATVRTTRRFARSPARVLTRRAASCEPTVGSSGFTVRLQRTLRPVGGGKVRRDPLTSVYPVVNSVVCVAPGQ